MYHYIFFTQIQMLVYFNEWNAYYCIIAHNDFYTGSYLYRFYGNNYKTEKDNNTGSTILVVIGNGKP